MLNDKLPLHEEEWIEKLAVKIFSDIETLTRDKIGISRESYGKGEALGIKYLIDLAEEFGFHIEKDDAANVFFSLDKSIKTNYILVGSHMDSVPQGGNFDGLAGVVAGFLLLVNLKEKKIKTSLPVKVLVLRGEESAWYGKNCIGSKALFGLLSLEDLNSTHRTTGEKLSKAMDASGANLNLIKKSKPLINSQKI
jgi:N-carbamoyl-L-amino-acid hydrolase